MEVERNPGQLQPAGPTSRTSATQHPFVRQSDLGMPRPGPLTGQGWPPPTSCRRPPNARRLARRHGCRENRSPAASPAAADVCTTMPTPRGSRHSNWLPWPAVSSSGNCDLETTYCLSLQLRQHPLPSYVAGTSQEVTGTCRSLDGLLRCGVTFFRLRLSKHGRAFRRRRTAGPPSPNPIRRHKQEHSHGEDLTRATSTVRETRQLDPDGRSEACPKPRGANSSCPGATCSGRELREPPASAWARGA
jgi:hypothetical protein